MVFAASVPVTMLVRVAATVGAGSPAPLLICSSRALVGGRKVWSLKVVPYVVRHVARRLVLLDA